MSEDATEEEEAEEDDTQLDPDFPYTIRPVDWAWLRGLPGTE